MPTEKHYRSPEDFDAVVDCYFADCQAREEKPTLTGMCLFLGFADRATLHYYKSYPDFKLSVKRARLRIEASYEQMLYTRTATGAMFALGNMLGWPNKKQVDHTTSDGSMKPTTVIDPAAVKKISEQLESEC